MPVILESMIIFFRTVRKETIFFNMFMALPRIYILNGSGEEMNKQLEKDVEQERVLLQERKDLVDSLSHEMKTPLGIIRAYAEGIITCDCTGSGKI